jgi:hypothetical protein
MDFAVPVRSGHLTGETHAIRFSVTGERDAIRFSLSLSLSLSLFFQDGKRLKIEG